MTDEQRPLLDIGSVRNLICPRHERALARDAGVNAYAFPLEILNRAMADPRTIEACQAGTPSDVDRAGAFLRSVAPVCEWLPSDLTAAAWEAARKLGQGGRA